MEVEHVYFLSVCVCVPCFMERAFDYVELVNAATGSRTCQNYQFRLFYEDVTVDMILIQRVEVWKAQLSTNAIISDFLSWTFLLGALLPPPFFWQPLDLLQGIVALDSL